MTGEKDAPAEMPGDAAQFEALARLIAPQAFKAFDDDYRPGQSAPSSAQMRSIGPMNAARAAARAFLAPILAEKERAELVLCDLMNAAGHYRSTHSELDREALSASIKAAADYVEAAVGGVR